MGLEYLLEAKTPAREILVDHSSVMTLAPATLLVLYLGDTDVPDPTTQVSTLRFHTSLTGSWLMLFKIQNILLKKMKKSNKTLPQKKKKKKKKISPKKKKKKKKKK